MTEPADATPPAPLIDASGMHEIADGVWIIPDRRVPLVPNVGIILGRDAALVVDTGMGTRNGNEVLGAARALAGERRLLLTITHFHPEHGYGAHVFRSAATIVYNRAQADELRAKGPGYLQMFATFGPGVAEALAGVEIVEPHVVYDGEADIDLGGRTVQLRTWGRAHTRSDQVVYLPDERILFAGDLTENAFFPIFPFFPPEDADVDGTRWIAVLDALESLGPKVVVPGHGAPGGAELLAATRSYMVALRDEVGRRSAAGTAVDDIAADLERLFVERHPTWEATEWIGFGVRAFAAAAAGNGTATA